MAALIAILEQAAPPASILLLAPMVPPPARSARPVWSALACQLGWAAGAALGTGPFVVCIAWRTVGMPGDPQDIGNWNHWVARCRCWSKPRSSR